MGKRILLLLPLLLLFATPGQSDDSSLSLHYQKMDSILKTKLISVDFESTPLKEVVTFLHNVTGINMVVDPSVLKEVDMEDLRVTMKVDDLPAGDVIDLILRFKSLGRCFRHGVLLITSAEHSTGKPFLRYYDINDLTFKIRDFPGPDIELKGSDDGEVGPVFPEDDTEDTTPTADSLTELIRETCGADSWDSEGRSIAEVNGMLLIRQTKEVHIEILRLFSLLRGIR